MTEDKHMWKNKTENEEKEKYEGGHARGKSRCDQISAVISIAAQPSR